MLIKVAKSKKISNIAKKIKKAQASIILNFCESILIFLVKIIKLKIFFF